MIRNARIIYFVVGLVLVLLLATAIAVVYFFESISTQTLSVVILVTGAIEFAAIFFGCFLLNVEENPVTDEDREQLFQTLTTYAQKLPSVLGLKIQFLVVLGKLYVPLLIICGAQVVAGLIILGITVQIPTEAIFLSVVFLGSILILFFKSLLFRPVYPEYPAEVEASVVNFPNLVSLVRTISRKAKAPKIHHINLVPGENCGVTFYSDFFGFREKNIMEIGLSLVTYFSEDELSALFAHEMAHIGNHDTLIGYHARVNLIRWNFLNQKVAKEKEIIRTLIAKFGLFYADYLAIHIDAISKPQEYAADALAAKITSKKQVASMLYKLHFLSALSPRPFDLADVKNAIGIPPDYFTHYLAAMKCSDIIDQKVFEEFLFSERSEFYDSHPTFIERLEALGIDSFRMDVSLENIVQLDQGIEAVLTYYDHDWHEQKIQEFEFYQMAREEDQEFIDDFEEDNENEDEDYENGDEAMGVGWALYRLGKKDEAIDHFIKVKKAFPESDVPDYAIAIVQLQNGDETGLPTVMEYTNRHACVIEDAVESIFDYFNLIKQPERIVDYSDWLEEKRKIYKEYQRELYTIRSSDMFLSVVTPHYDTMRPFYAELSKLKRIKAIYFLRKKCHYAGKGPLLVGIDVGFANTSKKDIEQVELLLDEIMPDLDFEGYITQSYEYDMRFFLKHFMGPKGNMVYNRKSYFKRLEKESKFQLEHKELKK